MQKILTPHLYNINICCPALTEICLYTTEVMQKQNTMFQISEFWVCVEHKVHSSLH